MPNKKNMQVIIGDLKKDVKNIGKNLFEIEGSKHELDIVPLGNNEFSVIKNHKNYRLKVVDVCREKKVMQLEINGKAHEITVKDEYDMLLDSLGMSNGTSKKIKEIKAPMPGLVLEVLAEDKKSMDKGSTLLILEAMKMENIIKSPDEVVVEKIHVKAGDPVEKNQVLITFE